MIIVKRWKGCTLRMLGSLLVSYSNLTTGTLLQILCSIKWKLSNLGDWELLKWDQAQEHSLIQCSTSLRTTILISIESVNTYLLKFLHSLQPSVKNSWDKIIKNFLRQTRSKFSTDQYLISIVRLVGILIVSLLDWKSWIICLMIGFTLIRKQVN